MNGDAAPVVDWIERDGLRRLQGVPAVVLMIGDYDGRPETTSAEMLAAAIELLGDLGPDVVAVPVIEAGHAAAQRATHQSDPRLPSGACFLYVGAATALDDPEQLVPSSLAPRVSVLGAYLYEDSDDASRPRTRALLEAATTWARSHDPDVAVPLPCLAAGAPPLQPEPGPGPGLREWLGSRYLEAQRPRLVALATALSETSASLADLRSDYEHVHTEGEESRRRLEAELERSEARSRRERGLLDDLTTEHEALRVSTERTSLELSAARAELAVLRAQLADQVVIAEEGRETVETMQQTLVWRGATFLWALRERLRRLSRGRPDR